MASIRQKRCCTYRVFSSIWIILRRLCLPDSGSGSTNFSNKANWIQDGTGVLRQQHWSVNDVTYCWRDPGQGEWKMDGSQSILWCSLHRRHSVRVWGENLQSRLEVQCPLLTWQQLWLQPHQGHVVMFLPRFITSLRHDCSIYRDIQMYNYRLSLL